MKGPSPWHSLSASTDETLARGLHVFSNALAVLSHSVAFLDAVRATVLIEMNAQAQASEGAQAQTIEGQASEGAQAQTIEGQASEGAQAQMGEGEGGALVDERARKEAQEELLLMRIRAVTAALSDCISSLPGQL